MKTRALVLGSSLFFIAASAHAADPQPGSNGSAMAEALFDQGRTLLDQGKTAEACDKFAASRKLDPAPGTTLNLADCYARLGRVASAWGIFVDAEADARRDGDARREKEAHDRAALLEPHLAHVRITIDSPPAGAALDLDGAPLTLAAAQSPLPVDPGHHRLRISAPGFVPQETMFDVAPGVLSANAHVARMRAAPKPQPTTQGPRVPFWSTPRVLSAVSAGLAVASAGVGVGFGAVASSKWNDASKTCPGTTCADANARAESHDAGTFADIATGAFVGAGVFAVAATVLYIVSPRPTSSSQVTAAPGGVSIPFY